MSWLDALQKRGQQARQQPREDLPAPVKAKPCEKPAIVSFWIQTRRPTDIDPGNIEPGFYYVADGVLVICDGEGKPTGARHQLRPNDEPWSIATQLRLEAWRKAHSADDFNRPLNYQHQRY